MSGPGTLAEGMASRCGIRRFATIGVATGLGSPDALSDSSPVHRIGHAFAPG